MFSEGTDDAFEEPTSVDPIWEELQAFFADVHAVSANLQGSFSEDEA